LTKNFFWLASVTGLTIGYSSDDSWGLDSIPVIFDTGTSLVYTPNSIGDAIPLYALSGVSY